MARVKYYYDSETCRYERVKVSKWDIFLNLLGFLTISAMMAVALFFLYTRYFESPQEVLLKKENDELRLYYEILEKQVDDAQKMLSVLQKRDDGVYRMILEADPIPPTIRQAGVGGVERYKDLMNKDLEREELIISTFERIEQLRKQMYIQTRSYDELIKFAKDKAKMLASLPAIQPISNKELTRLASGFGMRIDPVYKIRKMHYGCDFTAPRGTPVYATGDGVVKLVKSQFGGYGKVIEIDHGYGYLTRYAHLNMFNVKQGQKVKRGECIGYVGSTGKSTAPHLHYEVEKDNIKINPVHYFFEDLTADEYEKLLELASVENQSLS